MDVVGPGQPILLVPVILIVAGVIGAIAAVTARRTLALMLEIVAFAALAGMVLWTFLPP